MKWLPDPVREYTLAGLFTVGTAGALLLALVCAAMGGHETTVRCLVLAAVLAGFAALFWLEPVVEEYA